jgi:hypothetical protein
MRAAAACERRIAPQFPRLLARFARTCPRTRFERRTGPGIAALWLGERLDQIKVAAAGLVLAGLALVLFKPRLRAAAASNVS